MVEIAIVEAHSKTLHKVKKWINDQAGLNCSICEARVGRLFERLDLANPPDIVILELLPKAGTNLEHLKKLKILLPTTRFMIYAEQIEGEQLYKTLKKGVNAIVLKSGAIQSLLEPLSLLMEGQDYIDPGLSKNIINIFRGEVSFEQRSEAHLNQFLGLLNHREIQVVKGLSKGKQYKEIASDLYLSINTVRHYIKSIYKKFEVNNKVQLIKKLQGMPEMII
jgi:DNA-binding NarL/FixJ family response regulator